MTTAGATANPYATGQPTSTGQPTNYAATNPYGQAGYGANPYATQPTGAAYTGPGAATMQQAYQGINQTTQTAQQAAQTFGQAAQNAYSTANTAYQGMTNAHQGVSAAGGTGYPQTADAQSSATYPQANTYAQPYGQPAGYQQQGDYPQATLSDQSGGQYPAGGTYDASQYPTPTAPSNYAPGSTGGTTNYGGTFVQ